MITSVIGMGIKVCVTVWWRDFWKNLEDVPFNEDADGRLVLANDYRFMVGSREIAMFPKGTDREEIWHWFDENHPKGVAHLLYRVKK